MGNMGNPKHLFHLVTLSPWPLMLSVGLLNLTLSGGAALHSYGKGFAIFLFAFVTIILYFTKWNGDVIREASYLKDHKTPVSNGLRAGFLLFIVSEAMLFMAIFWSFFHSSLAPTVAIGSLWPSFLIQVINPYEVPLLNTIILLSSGATITLAHNAILQNNKKRANIGFILTLFLALLFTALQVMEYFDACFDISDGVYGSTFFFATGFHGLHVIIGTIFIIVTYKRFLIKEISPKNHFGFEAASWYWHFVDVIWLFLYLTVYIWGSMTIQHKIIYI